MKKIKQIKTYEIKDLNIKDNNRNYNFIETDEGENQNVKFAQNSINDKLNRNFVAKRNFSFENESPNGNTKISNDAKNEGKVIINDENEKNQSTRLNKFSQSNEDNFGSTLFKTNKYNKKEKDFSREIPIKINYENYDPQKYKEIHDEILNSIKAEKRDRNSQTDLHYNNYSLPHKNLNNNDFNQNENFYSFNEYSQPVLYSTKYSKKDFMNRSYKSAEPMKKIRCNSSEIDLNNYHCNHHCESLLLRNYLKSGKKISDFILKNRTKIKLFGNKNYKNRDPIEYLEELQNHPEVPLILSHNLFRCSNYDSSCYNNLAKLQPNHEVKVKEYKDFIKKNNEIIGTITHKRIEDTLNPVELTPIPSKSRKIIKSTIEKNEFLEAERNAVVRRRVEYTHNLYSKKVYETNEVKRFEIQDLKKKLTKRENDRNKITVNDNMLVEFDAMKELKKVINTKEKKGMKIPKESKKIISESVEDLVNEYHKELIKNRKIENIKKNKQEKKQKNINDIERNESNVKNSMDINVNGMKILHHNDLRGIDDEYYEAYIQRVILIQRAYRKYFLIKNFSAEFIQKNVKGFLMRKKINRYLSALRILKSQFNNLLKVVVKNSKRRFLYNLSTHKGIPYIFKLILLLQRRIKLFLHRKRIMRIKSKKKEKIIRFTDEYYENKNVNNGKIFSKISKFSFLNRINTIKPYFGFIKQLKLKLLKNSFDSFCLRMEKVIKRNSILKNGHHPINLNKVIRCDLSEKYNKANEKIVSSLRLNKANKDKERLKVEKINNSYILEEIENTNVQFTVSRKNKSIENKSSSLITKKIKNSSCLEKISYIQKEYRNHSYKKKMKVQENKKTLSISVCNENNLNVFADKKIKQEDCFIINRSHVEISNSRSRKGNLEITNSMININKSYEKSMEKEYVLMTKKINCQTFEKIIIFKPNSFLEKKSTKISNNLKEFASKSKKEVKSINNIDNICLVEIPESVELPKPRNKQKSKCVIITKIMKINFDDKLSLLRKKLKEFLLEKSKVTKSEILPNQIIKMFTINKCQDYHLSKEIKLGTNYLNKKANAIQDSLKSNRISNCKKIMIKPKSLKPSIFSKKILNQIENSNSKIITNLLKVNHSKAQKIIPIVKENKVIQIKRSNCNASIFTKINKFNIEKQIDLIKKSIKKCKLNKDFAEANKSIKEKEEEIPEIEFVGESDNLALNNNQKIVNKEQTASSKIMKKSINSVNYFCTKHHLMDKSTLSIFSNIIKNSLKHISYLKEKFNVLERIKLFYVLKNHFEKLKKLKISENTKKVSYNIEVVSSANLEFKKEKRLNILAMNILNRYILAKCCKDYFSLWKLKSNRMSSLLKIFKQLDSKFIKQTTAKSFDLWRIMAQNEKMLIKMNENVTEVVKLNLINSLKDKLIKAKQQKRKLNDLLLIAEEKRNRNSLLFWFNKYKLFMIKLNKERSLFLIQSFLKLRSMKKGLYTLKSNINAQISIEKGLNKLKNYLNQWCNNNIKKMLMKNTCYKNKISSINTINKVRFFNLRFLKK